MRTWRTAGLVAVALALSASSGGCSAGGAPLSVPGGLGEACLAVDADRRTVVLFDEVANNGDTPITLQLVWLPDSVNLDVVDARVLPDGVEPDGVEPGGATDGATAGSGGGVGVVRGPSIAAGDEATLEISLELYEASGDLDGTTRTIAISYTTGVTPATHQIEVPMRLRVVPDGAACYG